MKTATVTYLLSNNYNSPKHFVKRYILENENDIQAALKAGLITRLHIDGIQKIFRNYDRVVLNEGGGYCGMKGTWQVIPENETVHRALDAMLKGKSFRMRHNELQEWKNFSNGISSTWWVITAINADKSINVAGNNHDVLENIYMDSLKDL